jgi:acetate kinase
MIVLVLNAGSSSIKYQLFDVENQAVMAKGMVDKIGMPDSYLTNKRLDGDEVKLEGEILDHQAGIEYVLGVLVSDKHGSVKSLEEIDAVGHRVVHGGESFHDSALINDQVIDRSQHVFHWHRCTTRQT